MADQNGSFQLAGSPPPVEMSPPVVSQLVSDLARLNSLSARLHAAARGSPPDESPAAADKRDKIRAYAHDLAAMYIQAALDHLNTWRVLLHAGCVPIYAHFSLLRTAHESAYMALWLMEPGMSADERRTRGIAAQLDDYDERRKMEDDAGIQSVAPPGQTGAQRHAALLAEAQRLGLTRVDQRGRTVLRVTMPSTVDLFGDLEPSPHGTKGSWWYRLYSGYAHAKQWVLTMGAQQAAPFDAYGRTTAVVTSNDSLTIEATHRTVNAVERAVEAYEEKHQPSA